MVKIDWNEMDIAVEALKKGELVVFPTETVFGIACIATKEKAFERLAQAKKRSPDKPFTLMCSSIGQAIQYAEIDAKTISLMKETRSLIF